MRTWFCTWGFRWINQRESNPASVHTLTLQADYTKVSWKSAVSKTVLFHYHDLKCHYLSKEGKTVNSSLIYSSSEDTIKDSKNNVDMLPPPEHFLIQKVSWPSLLLALGSRSSQSKFRLSLVLLCRFFIPFMKHYPLWEEGQLIKEYDF